MKINKIKPIPKYIERLIYKTDKRNNPQPSGHTRFYAYFTKNDGELVKVTVAVRHRYTKWYCKQVAVHGIHSKMCFAKDIDFYYIAGYIVDWSELTSKCIDERFVNKVWYAVEDKYFDPFAVPVNVAYILKQPEFKYSAVNKLHTDKTLKYLRLYEKYPHAEYIVKLGLWHLAMSKQILSKAKKDKRFRKWLGQHRIELQERLYYVSAILTAYSTGKSVKSIQEFEESKKSLIKNNKELYRLFKDNLEQFFYYLRKQAISAHSYKDYYTACYELGLDMSLDRNLFPHDFKHWHDTRINEYKTKQAELDAKKHKELYDKFNSIVTKYLPLQRELKDAYIVIIAKSPDDLKQEGEILHHCVGSMGYEQKVIQEQSLIFFLRTKDNPQQPFVTVEYSLRTHQILQCYAARNSKPEQEVINYIQNTWLPYANRKLRKIAA